MPVLHVNEFAVSCRGILFDKDGTLVDLLRTWGLWAEIVLQGMEEQLQLAGSLPPGGIPGLLGTVHDASGRVIGYDPAGPLSMATAQETEGLLTWQLYAAGVPWNEALTSVRLIAKDAMAELRKRKAAHPLPGLLNFLEQCRGAGLKLGVVTSDGEKTTAEQLEWMNIASFFGAVVTREQVRYGKPDPEMAVTACRQLGLNPGETVIIGDSNADMQTGKNAGLALTIGIAGQGGACEHLPDADKIVSGFPELRVIPDYSIERKL